MLDAKVALLADLVRRSNATVAYTGAGISTASGIKDYASKAAGTLSRAADEAAALKPTAGISPWEAEPTEAHHGLVNLFKGGMLKAWVQQNHDGLPQKAGMPQHAVNEIHGAWYDPSNPVVPMDGTLREDCINDLLDWEENADLVSSQRLFSGTGNLSRGA